MISVIIPAYNEEKYLPKTLDSLQKQTHSDFEVIVVANGCTDRTVEIARKAKAQVITTPRQQIGAARNLGAKKAKGDILVFLDADTTLSDNALAVIAKEFTTSYSVGTLFAKPDRKRVHYRLQFFLKNLLHQFKLYRGSIGVVIASKKVMSKVQFPKTSMRENKFFISQALAHGKYFYTSHALSITSMRRYEKTGLMKIWLFWISKWFRPKKTSDKEEYEAVR